MLLGVARRRAAGGVGRREGGRTTWRPLPIQQALVCDKTQKSVDFFLSECLRFRGDIINMATAAAAPSARLETETIKVSSDTRRLFISDSELPVDAT